jgi:hypothetical protein
MSVITDLPLVADRGALPVEREGARDAGAVGRTLAVGEILRLLLFGVAEALLMRHLHRRWKSRGDVARGRDKGRGKTAEAVREELNTSSLSP